MISLAVAWRASCGFRLIRKRPLLSVVFAPSTPMNELKDWTFGVLEYGGGEDLLALRHRLVRYGFGRLGDALDFARILYGKESLGDEDVEQQRHRQRDARDTQA